ncbi:MAG: exodeoxyribonuclease VII small subunit [Rikenellaceae bacterium]
MAKNSVISYAEAQQEIESILERLNNEQMDIDALSSEVARAVELIDICKKRLSKAEADVNKLFNKFEKEEEE